MNRCVTSAPAPEMDRPRRRDANATRAAIVRAARLAFARAGYEGAYLKEIAADAGVDAALINRYFGGKEGLFAAALNDAIRSEKLFLGERANFGRDVAKVFAAKWRPETAQGMAGFQLILRAAMSPATAPMLNDAVQARFMGPIRDWLGGADAAARARLIASVFIGLLVEAMIRGDSLPEKERAAFIEKVTQILQMLVDA